MLVAGSVLAVLAVLSAMPPAQAGGCAYGASPVPTGVHGVCLLARALYSYGYCGTDYCYSYYGDYYTPASVYAVQHTAGHDASASAGVRQVTTRWSYDIHGGGPKAHGSSHATAAQAGAGLDGLAAGAGVTQARSEQSVTDATGTREESTNGTTVWARAPVLAASAGQQAQGSRGPEGAHSSAETGAHVAAGDAPDVFVGQRVQDGDCELVAGGAVTEPCGPVPVLPSLAQLPDVPEL